MASYTLTAIETYPLGTTVAAYPVTNWPATSRPPQGAPRNPAADSQTMGAASLTFTGLADNTQYYAGGQVSGQWRYIAFQTAAAPAGDFMSRHGLLATNYDPILASASYQPLTGRTHWIHVPITRDIVISQVVYVLGTAGAGMVAGQNWVGVMSSSQVLLGKAVDPPFTGALEDTRVTLTAEPGQSLAVTAGSYVYVMFLANATTGPKFLAAGLPAGANVGASANGYPNTVVTSSSGQTAFPPNMINAGNFPGQWVYAYWVGLA